MSRPKKLLITGVSGLLGNNLAYALRSKYQILGLYCSHEVFIDGIELQKADILSQGSLKRVLKEFSPNAIIHCAALADVDFCEDHQDEAFRRNVLGTKNIVGDLKGSNAKLIYISTDLVYDGIKGDFSETDPVNPPNYYGLTKLKGEQEALKYVNTLAARTTFFGWNIVNKLHLAEWIFDSLSKGKEIPGFTDVYSSSLYSMKLAFLLDQAIEKDLKGIYNFGCQNAVSKYEFAKCVAENFQLDSSLIRPISVEQHPFKAKRGKNLSLNVQKLEKKLKVTLPTIQESIGQFARDYQSGMRDAIRSKNRFTVKD